VALLHKVILDLHATAGEGVDHHSDPSDEIM
jgi:hypothetical protein